MFRVGDAYVLRLPRRVEAIETVHNEQRILPTLNQLVGNDPSLPQIPRLIHRGEPTDYFRHPWSLLTWLPGTCLFDAQLTDTSTIIEPLARFITALHQPADNAAPINPYRGGGLTTRTEATMRCLNTVGDKLKDAPYSTHQIGDTWERLVGTKPWDKPSVWLHGDIHPGNMLVEGNELSAVIDWGDVCLGDPATDLAVSWMLFNESDRALFRTAIRQAGHPADDATWLRAQAWALSLGLAHLAGSDQDHHTNLGRLVIGRALS